MHIDNLDFILKAGNLTNKFSKDANPNYVGIGETELIGKRADQTILTVDTGNEHNPSRDYLPFYYHYKSVMLYNIQNGFKVDKQPANDIVYLVYKLDDLIDNIEYLFTDGHGYASITSWYENIAYLTTIIRADVQRQIWNNTEDDPDRKRRKQAEFSVKQPLSLDFIIGIATYNDDVTTKVKKMCKRYNKTIDVKTKPNYYY
jgi:hypothetical protein